MSKPEEMKYLNKIGQILLEFAPEGWSQINSKVALVGNLGRSWEIATLKDGSEQYFDSPLELFTQYRNLRTVMYQPGRGAWISANFILTPPGSFRIEYNYEREIDFGRVAPGVDDYLEDLRVFPRDPEHIPDWLREKLREAEQQ